MIGIMTAAGKGLQNSEDVQNNQMQIIQINSNEIVDN